jgi:hypothetical protein
MAPAFPNHRQKGLNQPIARAMSASTWQSCST